MRIFVVGNINAGKTYLVNKLKNIFPNYPILSIDQYRMDYADGTIEKEIYTCHRFADDIIKYKDAIIEFSGGSNITVLFEDRVRSNSAIVIEVLSNLEDCLERIRFKDFSKIPYPKFSESMRDTIIRLDGLFKSNLIDKNFSRVSLKHLKITSDTDLDTLPLIQFENAIKIADAFENMPVSLIAFGSLSNNTLNNNSDIDLFMKTLMPFEDIVREIEKLYDNVELIIQKQNIAIFHNQQLIEINVIKDIGEAQLYYYKSEVDSVEKTILLNEEGLLEKLNELIQNFKCDFSNEFDYTLSRLTYYYYSLPRIIKKNDSYKYFFHTNILIHEYIKLTYFMKGHRSYSYLPKMVTNFISSDILNALSFSFRDDMEDHLSKIKSLINRIVIDAKTYKNNIDK